MTKTKTTTKKLAKHTARKAPAVPRAAVVAAQVVTGQIHLIRGRRVMLDSDLATLYQVETKVFNQAVKRNEDRFPEDFMFRLTAEEASRVKPRVMSDDQILRSQIVTSRWGGRRYEPFVFTEQGIAMLSSVLNSKRAIQVNITIMRAFVRLREIAATHKELLHKVTDLEKRYDQNFRAVFGAIKALMAEKPEPIPVKRRIGFQQ
jgi:hypothetical protein